MIKRTILGDRSRAKSNDDKELVRQTFIAVGRHLIATEHESQVSLRRIASEAGYTPAAIYRYFPNFQALLLAIREVDLNVAVSELENIAAHASDPIERVRRLAKHSAKHWLTHPEEFDVLFSRPTKSDSLIQENQAFGRSAIALRALRIYYRAVDQMFRTLSNSPLPRRLAADTLIAATYGIVGFPRTASTVPWSDAYKMAELAIDAIVNSWITQAAPKKSRKREVSVRALR